ncbi:MAG TPA: gliding motility-associated C-terminal domain-containing protein [Bacteroidetes bacterium]|nr:gliding motility-associated C-terminal domain-containing protein [Bacteroidota bacterium]
MFIIKNFPAIACLFFCNLLFCVFSPALYGNNSACPPPAGGEVVFLTLECGEDSLAFCADLSGLNGSLNGASIIAGPSNGNVFIGNGGCFGYLPSTGFEGNDSVCIVLCDDLMTCDTMLFDILVEACIGPVPCPALLAYDFIDIPVSDCSGLTKICTPFPLGQALLFEYNVNNQPYNGNLGICSFDTLYSYSLGSLPGGGTDGPYQLQSWVVNGDTLSGTFQDATELFELMNMLDPDGEWTLDSTTLNVSTFNTDSEYLTMTVVQDQTSDVANLNTNTFTAPVGSSIFLPTGVHEIVLTHQDDPSCTDTFTAVIHCKMEVINFDTIGPGQSNTACIDPSFLLGNLESINSYCPDCDNISTLSNGECTAYNGIAAGTDTLLLVACDDFGICDSVWQIITVEDNSLLPVANVDEYTVEENSSTELDLFANDLINGKLKRVFIPIAPKHGLVEISTDFQVSYRAEKDYCGIDGFAYVICNESGCDTSTVSLTVNCKVPFAYNGFSPNEDGINDTFKFFNIKDYPQNKLRIYNRWGNLVYEKSGYQNEWDGRSFDNNTLPDGTYFYLLEIEGGETSKGFVQINR